SLIALATPCLYTLSLHDALPICARARAHRHQPPGLEVPVRLPVREEPRLVRAVPRGAAAHDGRAHPRRPRVARCEAQHHLLVRRSEEHTSELQSRENLVCRLLLE